MPDTAGLRVREIKIADQSFRFVFSTLAIAALQDRWGVKTTDEALTRLSELESNAVRLLPDVVWAGLRRHHPEKTIDEVTILIDDHGIAALPGLMVDISKTIQASLPQAEGGKRPRPLEPTPTARQ